MPIHRDRIIRYTDLSDGLLSRLDRKRNILEIDRTQRDLLTESAQNRLDCSDADATRTVVVNGIMHFEELELAN